MNDLKKMILAGIGGASMSYDKAEEMVEELATRGQITVDQGKKLSEELIRKGKGKMKDDTLDKDEIQAILLQMNVAQRKDIEDLELKITALNAQMDELIENNK
ncbi:phasin family protein [Desemzia sp. FAM 23991]|uniref:phasin family protein n=1 Tax=unclassified Desemzia TaxID=2685243 RepID=UPI00388994A7